MAVVDDDTVRRAFDAGDGTAEPQPVCEFRYQFFHIALAAALDGAPDRTVVLQQAMIVKKGDEVLGGEFHHLVRWRRPDRRTHRR
jgi:hypothetical protein